MFSGFSLTLCVLISMLFALCVGEMWMVECVLPCSGFDWIANNSIICFPCPPLLFSSCSFSPCGCTPKKCQFLPLLDGWQTFFNKEKKREPSNSQFNSTLDFGAFFLMVELAVTELVTKKKTPSLPSAFYENSTRNHTGSY